jgi:hypothetical protein
VLFGFQNLFSDQIIFLGGASKTLRTGNLDIALYSYKGKLLSVEFEKCFKILSVSYLGNLILKSAFIATTPEACISIYLPFLDLALSILIILKPISFIYSMYVVCGVKLN